MQKKWLVLSLEKTKKLSRCEEEPLQMLTLEFQDLVRRLGVEGSMISRLG